MAPALRRSAAARAACLVCLIAAQAYAGGGDSEGGHPGPEPGCTAGGPAGASSRAARTACTNLPWTRAASLSGIGTAPYTSPVSLLSAAARAGTPGARAGHRHLAAPGSYRRLQQAAAGARGASPAGNPSATAQWLAAARAASGAPGSHAPAWASSVNASERAAAGAAPLPAPRHVPVPSPAAGAAAPPRAPGAFISCAPDVRNYAVPTAWAPSAAAPALTYTGTTIPDRNDECADVPDPPAPAAGHTRPPVSGKALSGLPPAVAAKAAQPGLPLGVFYDAAGQRWALGGGLAPRLLPPRNARAHVPAAPAAAPGAGAAAEAAGAPGMARGLVLATALGACVGAAALLAAALLALGWRRLRCCGARCARSHSDRHRQRVLAGGCPPSCQALYRSIAQRIKQLELRRHRPRCACRPSLSRY